MKTYHVSLTGATPLLLHNDNIEWSDQMEQWRKIPDNKKSSKAGDDRTPAFTWIGSMYFDGGLACIPADNLMTMLREGGAKCPTGKRQETFKRHTQSSLIVNESSWPIYGTKGTVSQDDVQQLMDIPDFEAHKDTAEDLGFMLFVKRAKIGQSKHVRVRPRFDTWQASGSITVLNDDIISKEALKLILDTAGMYAGMCDWRPSSPRSPGAFGKFTAEIK